MKRAPHGETSGFCGTKTHLAFVPSGIASCPSHRDLLNPQKECKIERIKCFSKEKEKP